MSNQTIANVVLIGAGHMGKIRCNAICSNPRFHLCGVCDADFNAARELARRCKTTAFQNFDQVIRQFHLHNPKEADLPQMTHSSDESSNNSIQEHTYLDGVILSIPTKLHAHYIEICASYNLIIFCEKPIAMHPNDIRELYNTCREHQVQLCCGFQRRFDESYVAVANATKRGDIGRPISVQVFFGDHPCPSVDFLREGGNIFEDLCIHDVDFVRWALGDEVKTAYATKTCVSEELERYGIHDTAVVVLTFESGCIATLNLSRWSSYGYDQRCDVFGDKGIVSVRNERVNSTVLVNENGEHHAPLPESFAQRFERAFAREMDAFADVMLLNKPWLITADDCCAVQTIADAALKSSETGCAIDLSSRALSRKSSL